MTVYCYIDIVLCTYRVKLQFHFDSTYILKMECIIKQFVLRTCCNRLNHVTRNSTTKSLNRKLMKEHILRKHLVIYLYFTNSLIYDLKLTYFYILCVPRITNLNVNRNALSFPKLVKDNKSFSLYQICIFHFLNYIIKIRLIFRQSLLTEKQ